MLAPDSEKHPRPASVEFPSVELDFLRQLARDLGLRSVTEAARRLSAAARTLFGVPPYSTCAARVLASASAPTRRSIASWRTP